MHRFLLINPNSNRATTDMMVQIAQSAASGAVEVIGATARDSPMMIVDPAALAAAGPPVVEIGLGAGPDVSGIIVSAFGDPGLADLRRRAGVPVVGIAEAAMLAASAGGRRFGVATTTPRLVGAIDARVAALGLGSLYTGTRVTVGDADGLVGDPAVLIEALGRVVGMCVAGDGAEAVIIGGGPLGDAAAALVPLFGVPVIAPIPAAVRRLMVVVGL